MLKVFSPWKSKRKKKPKNYEVWLANLPVVHVRKFGRIETAVEVGMWIVGAMMKGEVRVAHSS